MKRIALITALISISTMATAADEDVVSLQMRIDEKVKMAEAKNLQLSGDDISNITCAIVTNEITTTGDTVDNAADKYQLDPTISRCVQVNSATIEVMGLTSGGGGLTPP